MKRLRKSNPPSGDIWSPRALARHRRSDCFAAAIGLAGFVAAATPVNAQSSMTAVAVPIRIERCAVESRSELPDPFGGLRDERVTGVTVAFVNVRNVAANLIRVNVRYQASSQVVTARGSFDPNVPVVRVFAVFAGNTSGSDAATCALQSAAFRDGSAWSAAR